MEVDVGTRPERWVQLQQLGHRLSAVADDLHGRRYPFRCQTGAADPLRAGNFPRRIISPAPCNREHEGPHEQVPLETELLSDNGERWVGQVLKLEVRVERPTVVGPAAGFR